MHRRAFLRLLAVSAAGLALAPAFAPVLAPARPVGAPTLEEWVRRVVKKRGRVRFIVGTELLEHLRECNGGCAVKHFGDGRFVGDTMSFSVFPLAAFIVDHRPLRVDEAHRPVRPTESDGGAVRVSRAWLSSLREVVSGAGPDGVYHFAIVNLATFEVEKEWSPA